MRGFRTALLVAGVALVGVPAAAWAQAAPGQDQDRPDHGHGDRARNDRDQGDRGGGDRGHGGGDRPDRRADAPAAPVAPVQQPQGARPAGNAIGAGAGQARPDYGRRDPERDREPERRGQYQDRQGFDASRQATIGDPRRFDNDRRAGSDGRGGQGHGLDGRGLDGRGYDGRGNDGRGFDGRGYDDRGGSGWRGDRRYDWRGYRDAHREFFRGPRYSPPRGYGYGFGYRPFARGYRIQPFFYGREYWIDDPYFYRLPPAEGPYRWVRYYDDVLLVDLRSGVVVDVIRDFFWR